MSVLQHTLAQLRTGQLAGIHRLQLRENLSEFPREIFSLADSLQILDLSGNQLTELPSDLPRLHQLQVIFCSNNLFTELPEVLGQCQSLRMVGFKSCRIRHVSPKALPPHLRWLILTDNALEALPAEIGRCTELQKLMLAGNRLQHLPAELQHCTRLELLRISANQLDALPEWLLQMPRLAWLALAGNPFTQALETQALSSTPTPHTAWQQLSVQHQLGEGASGVIHQALLHTDAGVQNVAVKLFKGHMTSDGLPACEMAACMQAGTHPNLLSTLARVSQHPTQQQALVMPLLGPEFVNLAQPPSLESCTRDVYAPEQRFTYQAAWRILRGVAAATQHLHSRGILHGDLYAHNILHTAEGQALLSDFGAASFFDVGDAALANRLEKIEVRALGCLIEELALRCDAQGLAQLAQSCLDPVPKQRLSLSQVCTALDTMAP